MNYFEIFGLEESAEIDKLTLDKAYFALQKQYHPDISPTQAEYSAILNNAYSILKDDYKRFGYILTQKGFDLENRSHTFTPDFLMEMLDLGEEIEKLSPNDKEKLKQLYNNINSLYKKSLKQGLHNITISLYDEAFIEYQKMNFYRSFLEQIQNKLDQENDFI